MKPFLIAALFVALSSLWSTPGAAQLAAKTPFLSGLKEPQGMALDGDGNILICDYGAGEVLKYGRDGKLLSKIATGLKGPSQIVLGQKIAASKTVPGNFETIETIYVSESKANRVISIQDGGKIVPIGGPVEEPIGLARDATSGLFAVSHTTSKIYRFDDGKWNLVFAAPFEAGEEKRYGYRCLAFDGGAFLMTDEIGEKIYLLTSGGRLATWASGIGEPSGILIGPDGEVYVTGESEGGRLFRVNAIGEKQIVAEGLGRPRGIVFFNAKTVLVSDRNGKVWKLALS